MSAPQALNQINPLDPWKDTEQGEGLNYMITGGGVRARVPRRYQRLADSALLASLKHSARMLLITVLLPFADADGIIRPGGMAVIQARWARRSKTGTCSRQMAERLISQLAGLLERVPGVVGPGKTAVYRIKAEVLALISAPVNYVRPRGVVGKRINRLFQREVEYQAMPGTPDRTWRLVS